MPTQPRHAFQTKFMSKDDFRSALRGELSTSGILDSTAAQLRRNVIEILRYSGSTDIQSKGYLASPLSLEQAALRSLVMEYLMSDGMMQTISIFGLESGMKGNFLSSGDALKALGLSTMCTSLKSIIKNKNDEKNGEKMTEEGSAEVHQAQSSALYLVLTGATLLKGKDMPRLSRSTQTEPVDEELRSRKQLDQKLLEIQEKYQKVMHEENKENAIPNSAQKAKMNAFQKECENRVMKEKEEEMRRFREIEIVSMRTEETAKRRKEMDALRSMLKAEYDLKIQRLEDREKQARISFEHQEKQSESLRFHERQDLLREINNIKERREEDKRILDMEKRKLELEEERVKHILMTTDAKLQHIEKKEQEMRQRMNMEYEQIRCTAKETYSDATDAVKKQSAFYANELIELNKYRESMSKTMKINSLQEKELASLRADKGTLEAALKREQETVKSLKTALEKKYCSSNDKKVDYDRINKLEAKLETKENEIQGYRRNIDLQTHKFKREQEKYMNQLKGAEDKLRIEVATVKKMEADKNIAEHELHQVRELLNKSQLALECIEDHTHEKDESPSIFDREERLLLARQRAKSVLSKIQTSRENHLDLKESILRSSRSKVTLDSLNKSSKLGNTLQDCRTRQIEDDIISKKKDSRSSWSMKYTKMQEDNVILTKVEETKPKTDCLRSHLCILDHEGNFQNEHCLKDVIQSKLKNDAQNPAEQVLRSHDESVVRPDRRAQPCEIIPREEISAESRTGKIITTQPNFSQCIGENCDQNVGAKKRDIQKAPHKIERKQEGGKPPEISVTPKRINCIPCKQIDLDCNIQCKASLVKSCTSVSAIHRNGNQDEDNLSIHSCATSITWDTVESPHNLLEPAAKTAQPLEHSAAIEQYDCQNVSERSKEMNKNKPPANSGLPLENVQTNDPSSCKESTVRREKEATIISMQRAKAQENYSTTKNEETKLDDKDETFGRAESSGSSRGSMYPNKSDLQSDRSVTNETLHTSFMETTNVSEPCRKGVHVEQIKEKMCEDSGLNGDSDSYGSSSFNTESPRAKQNLTAVDETKTKIYFNQDANQNEINQVSLKTRQVDVDYDKSRRSIDYEIHQARAAVQIQSSIRRWKCQKQLKTQNTTRIDLNPRTDTGEEIDENSSSNSATIRNSQSISIETNTTNEKYVVKRDGQFSSSDDDEIEVGTNGTCQGENDDWW